MTPVWLCESMSYASLNAADWAKDFSLSCHWPKAKNAGGSGAEPLRSTGELPMNFDPNDRKTADMLSVGDSLGVFQSESPGMRQLLCGLKVREQEGPGDRVVADPAGTGFRRHEEPSSSSGTSTASRSSTCIPRSQTCSATPTA